MKEIWKPVPEFEQSYHVSNLGRIKRLVGFGIRKERILRPRKHTQGYLRVCLGQRNDKYIHRLVLLAFHGPSRKTDVNHIDGNKENNKLDNLEYCSRKQNMQHAKRIGLLPMGNDHYNMKISDDGIRDIRSSKLSKQELAFKYGTNKKYIEEIIGMRKRKDVLP